MIKVRVRVRPKIYKLKFDLEDLMSFKSTPEVLLDLLDPISETESQLLELCWSCPEIMPTI